MGKVFSWEEIKNGMIPNVKRDFDIVKNHICRQIKEFHGVAAASLIGSALSGKLTVRSDIDCVVVYSEYEQERTIRFLRDLTDLVSTYHIPLELIIVRRDMALSGCHPLQTTFLEHISLCARRGGLIKGDIAGSFSHCGKDIKGETLNYIINKMSKLEKRRVSTSRMCSEEYCRHLSKILDAHVHIARKVCRAKGIYFENDDSKDVVMEGYREISSRREYDAFVDSDEFSSFYLRRLEKQINSPDCYAYDSLLKKIESRASKVIRFACDNLRLLQ